MSVAEKQGDRFLWQDFEEPEPSTRLWRYLSLPMLLSFLHRRALWYSQLSSLPDWAEGTVPAKTFEVAKQEMAASGMKPDSLQHFIESCKQIPEFNRRCMYVNCWCEAPFESEALWRIYGGADGVALETTASRLRDQVPNDHLLGRVRYLDERDGLVRMSYMPNAATWKRKQFFHEREVRIVSIEFPAKSPHAGSPGFYQPVEPSTLLSRIVISPYTTTWVAVSIKAVIHQLAPGIVVADSEMRPRPDPSLPVTSASHLQGAPASN